MCAYFPTFCSQWQLIEEVGSDQRLREAAQYWREHHQKGLSLLATAGAKEKKRTKRGEQGGGAVDVKALGDQLLMKSGTNQVGGGGGGGNGDGAVPATWMKMVVQQANLVGSPENV